MCGSITVRLEVDGEFTCDNPSIDQLRSVLESQRGFPDSFFILRKADSSFLQGALSREGFFCLEYAEDAIGVQHRSEEEMTLEETLEITDAYVRNDPCWEDICDWKTATW